MNWAGVGKEFGFYDLPAPSRMALKGEGCSAERARRRLARLGNFSGDLTVFLGLGLMVRGVQSRWCSRQ